MSRWYQNFRRNYVHYCNNFVTRNWLKYLKFIMITGSPEASCCKNRGVPTKCLGICMGGCKDTPWETYKLVSTDNECHKFEQAGKECCETETPERRDDSTEHKYSFL